MSLYIDFCLKRIELLSKGKITKKKFKSIVILYEKIIRITDNGKGGAIEFISNYADFLKENYVYKGVAAEAERLLSRAVIADDKYYIAHAHELAGVAYTKLSKSAEAEKHLLAAEASYRILCADLTEKNRFGLANTLTHIADYCSKFGKTENLHIARYEATVIYGELLYECGNKYMFPYLASCNDLAVYYIRTKHFDDAFVLLEQCHPAIINVCTDTSYIKDEQLVLLLCICHNFAGVCFTVSKITVAKQIIEEAIQKCRIAKSRGIYNITSKIFGRASYIYHSLGETDKARAMADEMEQCLFESKKCSDYHPEASPYSQQSKAEINLIGNMDTDPDSWTLIM